jgi:hypothetical protein
MYNVINFVSAPAVLQTPRIKNKTEIAKWSAKALDLADYQVIPEVHVLSQTFPLSFPVF